MDRPDLFLHIDALCLVRLGFARCMAVVALYRGLLPSRQLVLADGLARHRIKHIAALTR